MDSGYALTRTSNLLRDMCAEKRVHRTRTFKVARTRCLRPPAVPLRRAAPTCWERCRACSSLELLPSVSHKGPPAARMRFAPCLTRDRLLALHGLPQPPSGHLGYLSASYCAKRSPRAPPRTSAGDGEICRPRLTKRGATTRRCGLVPFQPLRMIIDVLSVTVCVRSSFALAAATRQERPLRAPRRPARRRCCVLAKRRPTIPYISMIPLRRVRLR